MSGSSFGKIFRITTWGESHGAAVGVVIDGCPAGLPLTEKEIQAFLDRRRPGQSKYTTKRMESDSVEILSGVFEGKTTGTPISLLVRNQDQRSRDYGEIAFTYRPGHADFAGSVKYNQTDLRNILERSSARKTAIEVAVGAVAKQILKEFGITCSSRIIQIGQGRTDEEFRAEIDKAKEAGDTLGGKFEIIYENMPVGLGSYVHWDRMLDGKIAQAVMSIPAIKSVSIGNHHAYKMFGSEFHDQMYLEDGKIVRKTNNAGGIEGGMTNGEPIVVTAVMKPIPTLRKPLNTVDMKNMTECEAHFERSDTCAVEACSVVAENRIACVLADEFLLKFGGDSLTEIKNRL